MVFSLVIPTYNNLPELQRCLAALEGLVGASFEVLLGVDGSTDGTLEWLADRAFAFPLRVLRHPDGGNHGRSATRNLALPHVTGKYVLFMDSDMEAAPDLLQRHLQILARGVAVSIGTVHYRNRSRNLWVRYTSERGVAKYQDGAAVPFNYFITPNTALPAQYWVETGGFDPQIDRYGGEDMELGYRIHRQFDPRFFFNAQAIATTTQPKTLEEALPQLREYGATGLRYITAKWPELSNIYWVGRIGGKGMADRLLALLTRRFFQRVALSLLRITPFFLQKQLISYLVVAHVHEGFRTGRY